MAGKNALLLGRDQSFFEVTFKFFLFPLTFFERLIFDESRFKKTHFFFKLHQIQFKNNFDKFTHF